MLIIIAGRLVFAAAGSMIIQGSGQAAEFTAERVMKDMKSEERFSFIAGAVEGLAVARYFKDGKQPTGMNCIYGWFYDNNRQVMDAIYAAFERYPTYLPGSILYTLARQKCGE